MGVTVRIQSNLHAYAARRQVDARYASFDYCFNYFQDAHDLGDTAALCRDGHLELSCLHLGFYLASWGMMRGRAELLQRSVLTLAPVVEAIAEEPAESWALDVFGSQNDLEAVLALCDRIQAAYLPVKATGVLVTKTVLGIFGCVPAFDRFFNDGFRVSKFSRKALLQVCDYYEAHRRVLDQFEVRTLDFATGQETQRRYPRAKIIDMVFFQQGLYNDRRRKAEAAR
jgi:hypothetical protein